MRTPRTRYLFTSPHRIERENGSLVSYSEGQVYSLSPERAEACLAAGVCRVLDEESPARLAEEPASEAVPETAARRSRKQSKAADDPAPHEPEQQFDTERAAEGEEPENTEV